MSLASPPSIDNRDPPTEDGAARHTRLLRELEDALRRVRHGDLTLKVCHGLAVQLEVLERMR